MTKKWNNFNDQSNFSEHQATQISFKNCTPFTTCITKIYEATIDYPDDLDLVMPRYNLIEHSSNYSEKAGSLWFYSKEESTNFNVDIATTNNSKSFMHKAKLLETTEADGANGTFWDALIAAPWKYLVIFCWRSLEITLIAK